MCLGNNSDTNEIFQFKELKVKTVQEVKTLRIKIDWKLSFENHIKTRIKSYKNAVPELLMFLTPQIFIITLLMN